MKDKYKHKPRQLKPGLRIGCGVPSHLIPRGVLTKTLKITFDNSNNCKPKKHLKQEPSEMQASSPNDPRLTETTKTSNTKEIVQKSSISP
jgi:hypothetical protein